MTTKKPVAEFQAAYAAGRAAANYSANPHILTSNMSDAFVLGVWDALDSVAVRQIHKSRGYTWRLIAADGCVQVVTVDGAKVIPG